MKTNLVTSPFDFEDQEDDEEIETSAMTPSVKEYLKRLQSQEEWADIEWLPGDLS